MPQLGSADYEKLGRAMEKVVSSGYFNRRRLFTFSFLRGLFFGMGSAVGATLLLALILWLLGFFSELPFVGELFNSAQNTIESATDAN